MVVERSSGRCDMMTDMFHWWGDFSMVGPPTSLAFAQVKGIIVIFAIQLWEQGYRSRFQEVGPSDRRESGLARLLGLLLGLHPHI